MRTLIVTVALGAFALAQQVPAGSLRTTMF